MDDDYMSENFVNTIKEVRPGLLNKHEKRHNEILKRKHILDMKNKKIDKKALEETNRDKHLNTPLSSENVGFKMLARMGYQPSEGIGKINKRNFEPIKVDVKEGRVGIGAPPTIKKIKLATIGNPAPKVKINQEAVNSYRASARDKMTLQRISKNLEKARRLMLTLDKEAGIVETPVVLEPDEGDVLEEEDDDRVVQIQPPTPELDDDNYFKTCQDSSENITRPAENIQSMVTELVTICNYLRDSYYYCMWCGTRYESLEDMQQNCPGVTEDEH